MCNTVSHTTRIVSVQYFVFRILFSFRTRESIHLGRRSCVCGGVAGIPSETGNSRIVRIIGFIFNTKFIYSFGCANGFAALRTTHPIPFAIRCIKCILFTSPFCHFSHLFHLSLSLPLSLFCLTLFSSDHFMDK